MSERVVRELVLLVHATSEASPDDLPDAYSTDVSIERLRALAADRSE